MQSSVSLRRASHWVVLPVVAIGLGTLVAVFSSRHQAATPEEENPAGTGPALTLSTNSFDFGETLDGNRLRRTVTVSNTSPRPVEVVTIRTTCGCTAMIDQLPIRIEPGEARELSFELNTERTAGPIRSQVAIETEEPGGRQTYPIRVTALVRLSATLSTDTLDLGALRRGDTKQGEVVVSVHKPTDAAEPLKLMSVPQGLRAVMKEVTPPGGSPRQWRIECSLNGTAVVDEPFDSDLVIAVPSTVDAHRRVRVRARPLTTVTANPNVVNFSFFDSTTSLTLEKPVTLSTSGGKCFHIVSVHPVDAPYVQGVTQQDGVEGTAVVQLIVDAKKCPKGFFKTKVRVTYECEDGEETVTLVAQGYCR